MSPGESGPAFGPVRFRVQATPRRFVGGPGWMGLVLLLALSVATLKAAPSWYWSLPVEAPGRSGRAWLWLDPTCPRVEGVFLCKDNYAEAGLVEDSALRDFLRESNLALLYLRPGVFGVTFDVPNGDEVLLRTLLRDLAEESGLPALSTAPLFVFGHSASAPWAEQIAYAWPDQVAAVIHYKSGNIRNYRPAWATREIDHVPFLAINGEFEEYGPSGPHPPGESWEAQWWAVRDDLLVWRATGHRAAQAVMPGEGHFSWNERVSATVIFFLRGVLAARAAVGGPPTLAQGWLIDSAIKSQDRHPPAAWADYSGPRDSAWWLPDKATARLLDQHHGQFGGAAQTITYAQRSSSTTERDTLSGTWSDLRRRLTVAATASSGGPVEFRLQRGPARQTGPAEFTLLPAAVNYPGMPGSLEISAWQPGDATYRPVERVARINLQPYTSGTVNSLTFDFPASVSLPAEPLALHATAASGETAAWWVACGPAELVGDTLVWSSLPRASERHRATAEVVARAWGTATYRQTSLDRRTVSIEDAPRQLPWVPPHLRPDPDEFLYEWRAPRDWEVWLGLSLDLVHWEETAGAVGEGPDARLHREPSTATGQPRFARLRVRSRSL